MHKQAINFVVIKYVEHQEEREEKGVKRVESGIRKKLAKRAIKMFGIKGEFDVPKQTVFNHIASEWLEVWHPGTESPMLEVEVVLISFVFTAQRLCCPLDVGDVIVLMNALISGTVHEKRLIQWKKTHCSFDADAPLVGRKWFRNFCRRNLEVWSQKAQNYTQNREDHCKYAAFSKMSN